MGTRTVSCLILLLSMTGFRAHAASDPNTPLIDFADTVMKRACPECPGFVGQMIGANPIRLGEVKDKSDIVIEDCHFTLVGPDTVMTASHCLRRWTREWSAKANGDCSKAYRFYFPETRESPFESADCQEIISPISMKSGLLQMEPDDVLVRLKRPVNRDHAEIDWTAISDSEELTLWGYDGITEEFQKRTCRRIQNSLLTPLDATPGSGYTTLTCDGGLATGWSGDGVFANGRLKGVVSFGLAQTTFGVSFFGENEIAVSQTSCSISSSGPLPAMCLPSAESLNLAMHDLYISAIGKATDWLDSTRELIQVRFPYVELEYAKGPQRYPQFSYTPEFHVRCMHRANLPAGGQILTGISFNLDTFYPRYVVFNPDTTIHGVSRRDPAHPEQSAGEFNIGFEFAKSDFTAGDDGVTIPGRLVPYCK